MKIKILVGCSIKGVSCPVGKVINVEDSDARILIGMGRAEPTDEIVTEESKTKGLKKSSMPTGKSKK